MSTTLTVWIRVPAFDGDAGADPSGGIVEASPVDQPRDITTVEADANGRAELQIDIGGTYRVSFTKNLDGAALLGDANVVIVEDDLEIEIEATLHHFE